MFFSFSFYKLVYIVVLGQSLKQILDTGARKGGPRSRVCNTTGRILGKCPKLLVWNVHPDHIYLYFVFHAGLPRQDGLQCLMNRNWTTRGILYGMDASQANTDVRWVWNSLPDKVKQL